MADCSGIWTSKIRWRRRNGEIQDPPLDDPDGEFTIDPHTGTTFTGQHHESPHTTPLFNTLCIENGLNRFRIRIHRLDLTVTPPEQFIYTGTGTIDPDTGEMVVTDGDVRVPGPPEPNDVGTWEASRPGSGGDEDEEKEKDKKDKNRPNENAVAQ